MRCPVCGAGWLNPAGDWSVCAVCGHRAATAYVDELAQLTEQHRIAAERLAWLTERVRLGDAFWTGTVAPTASGPLATVPAAAAPGQAAGGALTGQQALLVTGGALLVTAVAVFLAVSWSGLGLVAQVLVVLLAVLVAGGLAHLLRPHSPATAGTLSAVAGIVLGIALAAAPHLRGAHPFSSSGTRFAWYAAAGLLTALACALAWRLTRDGGYAFAAVVSLVVASAADATWMVVRLDPVPLLVVSTVQTLLVAVVCRRTGRRATVPGIALGYAPALLAAGAMLVAYARHDHPATVGGLLLLVAAVLAVDPLVSGSHPGPRRFVPSMLAVSAAVGSVPGPATAGVVAVLTGSGVVTFVLVRRDRRVALAAGGPAAAGALLAFTASSPADLAAAQVWAVAALVLFALATQRPIRHAGIPAVLCAWIAVGALSAAYDWSVGPEQFALLVAGPALLAGVARWVAVGSALPSLAVWGPGLALLVLPSAVSAASGDGASQRTLGVLLVAGALAAAGAALRSAAPVVVGVLAAVLVLGGQLVTVAQVLPRWVGLSAAGAALLVAGLRIEQLRALAASGRTALAVLR